MTRGRLPDLRAFVMELQNQGNALAQEIAGDVRLFAPVYEGPDPRRTGGAYQAAVVGEAEATEHGVTITIKAPAPLTTWIIEGTKPHTIAPKQRPNGRMGRLVFYVNSGEIVFLKPGQSVTHPGTSPNPYPLQAGPLIEDKITAVVLSVLLTNTQ